MKVIDTRIYLQGVYDKGEIWWLCYLNEDLVWKEVKLYSSFEEAHRELETLGIKEIIRKQRNKTIIFTALFFLFLIFMFTFARMIDII